MMGIAAESPAGVKISTRVQKFLRLKNFQVKKFLGIKNFLGLKLFLAFKFFELKLFGLTSP